MKKLLLKIFLMMGISMLLVFGISRMALAVLQSKSISDPIISYHISLISGALGLMLFTTLLYIFVGKRLKALSVAVNEVANGKLDIQIPVKGRDELSQLSGDFNRMTDGLKSNEYLNREFVRNVSHEFKTPLSIILGYSDLLTAKDVTDGERNEYIGFIQKEAARLTGLSEKLLAISRLDSDYAISCDDRFSLDNQIRDIVLSMQVAWSEKNLNLDVDMAEIDYVSNKDLCYLVWQNLISNAVKYTPEGGEISIKLYKEKDSIIFSITNTGDALRGRETLIFNHFTQAMHPGKRRGQALGFLW